MKQWLAALNFDVDNPWLLGLIKAAIVIAAFTGFIALSKPAIFKGLKKLLNLAHIPVDNGILITLHRLSWKVLILVCADWVFSFFPFQSHIAGFIHHTLFIALVLVVLTGVFELTSALSQYLFRLGASDFQPLVSKLLNVIFALVGLMIVLRHFNHDIWHIVGALGIGSLAIGLAAQPTLSNMIAGFTILIDRPFKPGDRIRLSTQETGDVIQIGMRSTHIKTLDGNMLIVPNSELSNSRVVNYNFPTRQGTQKVRFHFEPGANFEEIRSSLLRANEKIDGMNPKSLSVLASGFNDRGVEFTITYEVENFMQDGPVKDAVIKNSLSALKEKQIKIVTGPGFPSS